MVSEAVVKKVRLSVNKLSKRSYILNAMVVTNRLLILREKAFVEFPLKSDVQ